MASMGFSQAKMKSNFKPVICTYTTLSNPYYTQLKTPQITLPNKK